MAIENGSGSYHKGYPSVEAIRNRQEFINVTKERYEELLKKEKEHAEIVIALREINQELMNVRNEVTIARLNIELAKEF